jgi:hypothetical protein
MEGSVAAALGANMPVGSRVFILFVPSVDREGRPIDHDYWREEALRVFGTLFRGATAYPQGRGVWRDDAAGGALVFDDPSVVHCWADPAAVTPAALARLRAFLHRMGRDAGQGEVGMVVDNEYTGITEFDAETEE